MVLGVTCNSNIEIPDTEALLCSSDPLNSFSGQSDKKSQIRNPTGSRIKSTCLGKSRVLVKECLFSYHTGDPQSQ